MNKPRVGLGRLSFAVLTLFCLMFPQHSLRASDEVLSLQGRIHFNINTND
jgi:hypothetical protein